MTERLAVLGSTGSVGRQALDVCRHGKIKVTALAAGRDIDSLEQQIREFAPEYCGVSDEEAAAALRVRVADTATEVLGGAFAAERVAALCSADTILNAVSGIAGLRPTLAAAESGKHIALANKESLVTYGERVTALIKEKGVRLLPVDSEHSAILQCLTGQQIKRLILTASGGPFYGRSGEELAAVTAEEALSHPTWRMGSRITVDSATMMNKGFEVIEAIWLFGVRPEQVEVVVHRESIIHSMVEYIDNTVIAQMGLPDMRLCVQYALTCPQRLESPVGSLDFGRLCTLTFGQPDGVNFPLLPLAYRAVSRGGVTPAAMNGADEEAVRLFLSGKISFPAISALVAEATERAPTVMSPCLEEIEAADAEARRLVRELAKRREYAPRPRI